VAALLSAPTGRPPPAGTGTFELARYMGTSVEMIERTYGHLVSGADDAFRSRLDACAAEQSSTTEQEAMR
jgi:hypothetical protein